jgi:3',5'-cyclic AMP phosphodiesterase CpdA
MRRFNELARGFEAPHRAIAGNHDAGNRRLPEHEDDAHEVTAERVARFEEHFGPSFWREEVNGAVRVLGVNASLFGSGLAREAEQWQWLETELGERAAWPTLLATHYPLYLETPDEAGETEWNAGLLKSYWTIEPHSRRRLLKLIARGNVRAVLSGHLHHPLRHERDGVLYLSSPPVAFALPRTQPPGEKSWPGWTLITVSDDGEIEAQWQVLQDA